MTAEFLRHEPCEVCGSSDAKAVYDDGNTFCFSCHNLTRADNHTSTHAHQCAIQRISPKAAKTKNQ